MNDKSEQEQQSESWEVKFRTFTCKNQSSSTGRWWRTGYAKDELEATPELVEDFIRAEIEKARREGFEDGHELGKLETQRDEIDEPVVFETLEDTRIEQLKQKYLKD